VFGKKKGITWMSRKGQQVVFDGWNRDSHMQVLFLMSCGSKFVYA
jgi:hypothetical protein